MMDMELKIKLLNRDGLIKKFSALLLIISIVIEGLNIMTWHNSDLHNIMVGVFIANILYILFWNIIKMINFVRFMKAMRQ